MNIGMLLRQLRKERNLTLNTVARCVNISITTLSEYERNIIDPPFSKVYSLLQFYNVSASIFLKENKEYICISNYSEINRLKVLEINRIETMKNIII